MTICSGNLCVHTRKERENLEARRDSSTMCCISCQPSLFFLTSILFFYLPGVSGKKVENQAHHLRQTERRFFGCGFKKLPPLRFWRAEVGFGTSQERKKQHVLSALLLLCRNWKTAKSDSPNITYIQLTVHSIKFT